MNTNTNGRNGNINIQISKDTQEEYWSRENAFILIMYEYKQNKYKFYICLLENVFYYNLLLQFSSLKENIMFNIMNNDNITKCKW